MKRISFDFKNRLVFYNIFERRALEPMPERLSINNIVTYIDTKSLIREDLNITFDFNSDKIEINEPINEKITDITINSFTAFEEIPQPGLNELYNDFLASVNLV